MVHDTMESGVSTSRARRLYGVGGRFVRFQVLAALMWGAAGLHVGTWHMPSVRAYVILAVVLTLLLGLGAYFWRHVRREACGQLCPVCAKARIPVISFMWWTRVRCPHCGFTPMKLRMPVEYRLARDADEAR